MLCSMERTAKECVHCELTAGAAAAADWFCIARHEACNLALMVRQVTAVRPVLDSVDAAAAPPAAFLLLLLTSPRLHPVSVLGCACWGDVSWRELAAL
jgi:hypothetical protein